MFHARFPRATLAPLTHNVQTPDWEMYEAQRKGDANAHVRDLVEAVRLGRIRRVQDEQLRRLAPRGYQAYP